MRTSLRTVSMWLALGAVLLVPGAGADVDRDRSDADQVTESKTKVSFPRTLAATEDLPELVLTGVGARTKLRFKVYGCAHYVAAGVDLGDTPAAAVITGDFARKIVMQFMRDVGADKITGAYVEGFEKNGYSPLDPVIAPALESFLAYFDRDLEKGDVIELTIVPDRGLLTVIGGEARPIIAGDDFISGLWAIWFGHKPVSEGLREDLLALVAEE